jgi:hypothetical protein
MSQVPVVSLNPGASVPGKQLAGSSNSGPGKEPAGSSTQGFTTLSDSNVPILKSYEQNPFKTVTNATPNYAV